MNQTKFRERVEKFKAQAKEKCRTSKDPHIKTVVTSLLGDVMRAHEGGFKACCCLAFSEHQLGIGDPKPAKCTERSDKAIFQWFCDECGSEISSHESDLDKAEEKRQRWSIPLSMEKHSITPKAHLSETKKEIMEFCDEIRAVAKEHDSLTIHRLAGVVQAALYGAMFGYPACCILQFCIDGYLAKGQYPPINFDPVDKHVMCDKCVKQQKEACTND